MEQKKRINKLFINVHGDCVRLFGGLKSTELVIWKRKKSNQLINNNQQN